MQSSSRQRRHVGQQIGTLTGIDNPVWRGLLKGGGGESAGRGWTAGRERGVCAAIAEPHPGPPSCIPPTCPPHQAVTRPTLPEPHLSHPQPPKCLEPPSHPEEPSDLEELEQFARTFKQRRIKLGFTQVWSRGAEPAVGVGGVVRWWAERGGGT